MTEQENNEPIDETNIPEEIREYVERRTLEDFNMLTNTMFEHVRTVSSRYVSRSELAFYASVVALGISVFSLLR